VASRRVGCVPTRPEAMATCILTPLPRFRYRLPMNVWESVDGVAKRAVKKKAPWMANYFDARV